MGRLFEETIVLNLSRLTSPEAVKREHIAVARRVLASRLSGLQVKPDVEIEVDGRAAQSEDEVRPFGVITYNFSRLRQIALFALTMARQISPVYSGRYRGAWFAMVDGKEAPVSEVPTRGVVAITNDRPYARKIHVGARGFEEYSRPVLFLERVRQATLSKYRGQITAEIQFITLDGGYVLKKGLRHIRKGRRYGGVRNDSRAGTEIKYPALFISNIRV